MKKSWFFLFVLVTAVAAGTVGVRLRKHEPVQKQTRFLMGALCTIRIPGGPEALPVIARALDRAEEIDRRFNPLNPGSPLYAFNQQGTPITQPDIVALVQTALDVSRKTDGAFDITVFPLIELWGFEGSSPRLPEQRQIDDCLKKVGWRKLVIEAGTLTKLEAGVKIDLGGIAKGYAVAEAVTVLTNANIRSALVDFGGDIYALGANRGKPWKIGIRKPVHDGGVLAGLDVSDMSLATSGDYERCFEKDGVRYHHILDPKTGYPARGIAGITVLTPDPTMGDAYSTALFVMGPERAMPHVAAIPSMEAVMITSKGTIDVSNGLKDRFAKP
ncbi:MAG: FAD:protein FMN transferase [Lentisphaerae bacterium]|nr:FAD:protein FMN transferase [Lentisphaerota bacterium]